MERGQLSLHHCFHFSTLCVSSSRGWGTFIFFSFALTDHIIGSLQKRVNSCMKAGINSQDWRRTGILKPVLPLETCKMTLHLPQSWRFANIPELSQRRSVYVYISHAQKAQSCSNKSNWWKVPAFVYIFLFTLVEGSLLNSKCFTSNLEPCRYFCVFLKYYIYIKLSLYIC